MDELTRDVQPTGPRSSTSVVVISRVPAIRRGLCACLREAGFQAIERANVVPGGQRVDALLLCVATEKDWETLSRLSRESTSTVVALLENAEPFGVCRALRYGAGAVVAQDAPLDEIVAVLHAALAGMTLLSQFIARALAGIAADVPRIELSEMEISWLRLLARGTTLAAIAVDVGYSERQIHRLLSRLYRRMGARSRSEALVLAARWGVIDESTVFPAGTKNGENHFAA